jgi:hypothetical protein
LLLPAGSRLFYIGAPKTGTTAVQLAAARSRAELLQHGVYYPGTRRNHRREVYAFLGQADPSMARPEGRREPTRRGGPRSAVARVPDRADWQALLRDIDQASFQRVLVSHEAAAGATADQAAGFVRELGPDRTHVVISLRAPAELLPSRWIELLKDGLAEPFESWIGRVYGKNGRATFGSMWRYLDMGRLVDCWADAAGAGNVTVVIADKADPAFLTTTFERLLGLTVGLLTGAVTGGYEKNRSMSLPEAEVLRAVNAAAYDRATTPWALYHDVIRSGAVKRILDGREPADDEPRVGLPGWAADRAERDGRRYAERIIASGVRVVGDPSRLYHRHPAPDGLPEADDPWYRAIAVQALAGALDGAIKAEAKIVKAARLAADADPATPYRALQKVAPADRPAVAARAFTTHELGRALALRLRHRLRSRTSMPRK